MAEWKDTTPLGKATEYSTSYDPALLFPIPRTHTREAIGYEKSIPFQGADIWNAYEISWLNKDGKPSVAILQMTIPCESPFIVESKSLKLYFNALNHTRFDSLDRFIETVQLDIENALRSKITIKIILPADWSKITLSNLPGSCIDDEKVALSDHAVNETLLQIDASAEPLLVDETLFSHLMRSNCPVTNQPDWASVWVHYVGPKIKPASLLEYFISFRNHNEFHEQCVERIFRDINAKCAPQKLTVYARFTRRGGIDINPFRTNENYQVENWRVARQ